MARSSLERGLLFFDLLLPDRWQASEELGRQLGVSGRQVKKYAALFRAYGWPIAADKGRGRGYKLEDGHMEPPRFTSRELFALAILLAQGASCLPGPEADRLKSKLKALLSDPSRAQVDHLEERVSVPESVQRDWELIELVARCLAQPGLALVIDYRGTRDSEPRRRHVLPGAIRVGDATWLLDGYDLDKREERSFRFDRVHRAAPLRLPEGSEMRGGAGRSVHKWDFGDAEPVEVQLEVNAGLARWLRENPAHPSQVVAEGDEAALVTYRVRLLERFADWVMGLRGARVVGPRRLVEIVGARAQAWLSESGTLEVGWESGS